MNVRTKRNIDLHENFGVSISHTYDIPKSEDIIKYYNRNASFTINTDSKGERKSSFHMLMDMLTKIKKASSIDDIKLAVKDYVTIKHISDEQVSGIIERAAWLHTVLCHEYCRYIQITVLNTEDFESTLDDQDDDDLYPKELRSDFKKFISSYKEEFTNVNIDRYAYLKMNGIVFNKGPIYDSLNYLERCSLFEKSKSHQTMFNLKDKLSELVGVLSGSDPEEIREGILWNIKKANEEGINISYRDYCESMLGLYGNYEYKTIKYLNNITPELDQFLAKYRDKLESTRTLTMHGKVYHNRVTKENIDKLLDANIYILINDLSNFILDQIMIDVENYKRRYRNDVHNNKSKTYAYATGSGMVTSRGMGSMIVQNPHSAQGSTLGDIEIEFPYYHIIGSSNVSFDLYPEEYNANLQEFPLRYIFRDLLPDINYNFSTSLM